MKKIQKNIEIVSSTTTGIMSAPSRAAIQGVLKKYYQSVIITMINSTADLEALVARKPDLVFLGLKFFPTDLTLGIDDPHKIWVAQYLDAHHIAYTGSGQLAHELELHKELAKQCVLESGCATAKHVVVRRSQPRPSVAHLKFPLFVKPTNRGGGAGIDSASLVLTMAELQAKLQTIAQLPADALIEEYLPGREFSVAILKDEHSAAFSLMPIELVTRLDYRGARILGGAVKASNSSRVLNVDNAQLHAAVSGLAMAAFQALGARDYGRIDIRLDAAGVPHFLEANLLPSLIRGYGSFPMACELNNGLAYEAMIVSIVRLALVRNQNDVDEAITLSDTLRIPQAEYSPLGNVAVI